MFVYFYAKWKLETNLFTAVTITPTHPQPIAPKTTQSR